MKIVLKKVKLRKAEELENASVKNNIPIGNEYTGIMLSSPMVGGYMEVQQDNGRYFYTSTIEEMITDFKFRTRNSVYEYEIIEEIEAK